MLSRQTSSNGSWHSCIGVLTMEASFLGRYALYVHTVTCEKARSVLRTKYSYSVFVDTSLEAFIRHPPWSALHLVRPLYPLVCTQHTGRKVPGARTEVLGDDPAPHLPILVNFCHRFHHLRPRLHELARKHLPAIHVDASLTSPQASEFVRRRQAKEYHLAKSTSLVRPQGLKPSSTWTNTGGWTPFLLQDPRTSTILSASACAFLPVHAVHLSGRPLSRYRMNLEGDEPPVKYSTLLDRPDLRHIGSNTR